MNDTSNDPVALMRNKVPEAADVFWAIKIMATTVGGTGADYLAVHVGSGTAVTGAITLACLLVAFIAQLRKRGYVTYFAWRIKYV